MSRNSDSSLTVGRRHRVAPATGLGVLAALAVWLLLSAANAAGDRLPNWADARSGSAIQEPSEARPEATDPAPSLRYWVRQWLPRIGVFLLAMVILGFLAGTWLVGRRLKRFGDRDISLPGKRPFIPFLP